VSAIVRPSRARIGGQTVPCPARSRHPAGTIAGVTERPARLTAVLPALDEAVAIASVVRGCLTHADEVLVVDGGSRDATAELATAAGARVLHEPRRGYGRACATGAAAAQGELLVFVDADGSLDPDDIPRVVAPVAAGALDLVLGARTRRPGNAMAPHLRLANRVLGLAVRPACGRVLSDLGPLRAIRRETLAGLAVADLGFGWPLDMVLRAGRAGLRVGEVDVHFGPRLGGSSKATGSLRGLLRATRAMSVLLARDLTRRATPPP
jgi:glycosyltransferase involved in cell wall biosynthesis